MAIATYTASSQTATPKANHVGLTVAKGTFTLNGAASYSASDVVLFVKIPNGAWIIDGYINGTAGDTATIFKLGTAADDDLATAAATISTAAAQHNRFDGAVLPFKVSLSDDAVPQWTWLKGEIVSVGSSSVTMSVQVTVMYTMQGL